MAVQLHLPPDRLSSLAVIRDLGEKTIAAIIAGFSELDPSPLKAEQLETILQNTMTDNQDDVPRVLRQLLSLYGLRRQRKLEASELLEGIQYGIDRNGKAPEWDDDAKNKWRQLEPILSKLLSIDQVWNVAKAIDLQYEYANLFQSARIVTDIRPVFDKTWNNITGSVISHTLRIYYDNLDGNHSLSLALDDKDIARLIEQCERARTKADTAKKYMKSTPTIISGKD